MSIIEKKKRNPYRRASQFRGVDRKDLKGLTPEEIMIWCNIEDLRTKEEIENLQKELKTDQLTEEERFVKSKYLRKLIIAWNSAHKEEIYEENEVYQYGKKRNK